MPSSGGIKAEVIVSGVNEFDTAIETLKDRFREAARQIVSKGSLILADSMKKQYRPRPGGSMRISHITGRKYWEGAPKFPAVPPKPTIRSGNTLNSIRPKKIVAIGLDTWMSQTGPTTAYEVFPELGTRYIHIPFPMVRMGIEDAADDLQALAEEEWAEAAAE